MKLSRFMFKYMLICFECAYTIIHVVLTVLTVLILAASRMWSKII